MTLTERTTSVLRAIANYINEFGFPPSVVGVSELCGFKSTSTTWYHMERLRRLRLVDWIDGRNRTLRLLDAAAPYVEDLPRHEPSTVETPLRDLPPERARVLATIAQLTETNGIAPTLRELRDACERELSTVYYHVSVLRAIGLLDGGVRARGVLITQAGRAQLSREREAVCV